MAHLSDISFVANISASLSMSENESRMENLFNII